MADTIGDLIDKLTIVNIRLWILQDEKNKDSNKISKVNQERNILIDQINAAMRVLIDKASQQDSSFCLTADELLGTGKNKFYKK